MKKKLAIVTTHPIQYNAPIFKLLNERGLIDIKVFYTWGESVLKKKFDPGFAKEIEWDIPLLEGYSYCMVHNASKNPGSHHFNGIKNPTLISDIKNWGAHALLVFGWNFRSHLYCLKYFHGRIPVFFRGDSNLIDDKKNIKSILRQIFLKLIYRYVDHVFYVGKANKKYFIKFGVPENKLSYAPHAIDNSRFNSSSKKNYREDLNIPKNSIVFLFAGKFEEKKNPLLLIDAFSHLNGLNYHLIMAGSGPLKDIMKSTYLKFNSEIINKIKLIDFQNQTFMPSLYQSADVFVLPSKGPGETWGLSINEAMASGKAIIASDKCGSSVDLIKNGINGFVFKNNDLKSLINLMQKFINDRSLSFKMGEESKIIIQNNTFEIIADVIEKRIEKATNSV